MELTGTKCVLFTRKTDVQYDMATAVNRRSACARQEVPVLLHRQHPLPRRPLLHLLIRVRKQAKLTAREQDAKDQATAKRLVGAAVLTGKRRDTSGSKTSTTKIR